MEDKDKLLLRVIAPHFVAGGVFKKTDKGWRCTSQVAPILKWIQGKDPQYLKNYFIKKRYKWQWLNIDLNQ